MTEKTLVGIRVKEGDWLGIAVNSKTAKRFTYFLRTIGFAARWYNDGEAVPAYVKPVQSLAQRKMLSARINQAAKDYRATQAA